MAAKEWIGETHRRYICGWKSRRGGQTSVLLTESELSEVALLACPPRKLNSVGRLFGPRIGGHKSRDRQLSEVFTACARSIRERYERSDPKIVSCDSRQMSPEGTNWQWLPFLDWFSSSHPNYSHYRGVYPTDGVTIVTNKTMGDRFAPTDYDATQSIFIADGQIEKVCGSADALVFFLRSGDRVRLTGYGILVNLDSDLVLIPADG
jgi:hypothetical protein